MIDTSKWNISYIGEKAIKPMYEDSSFPISLADEIKSAIEKHIPKKPLGIENDNRYGCVLECFECKTILSGSEERPLYCPECGQKLDWSVENE